MYSVTERGIVMRKKKGNRSNIDDFSSLPLFSESVKLTKSSGQMSTAERRAKVVSIHKFRSKQTQDQKANIISGYLLLAKKTDW